MTAHSSDNSADVHAFYEKVLAEYESRERELEERVRDLTSVLKLVADEPLHEEEERCAAATQGQDGWTPGATPPPVAATPQSDGAAAPCIPQQHASGPYPADPTGPQPGQPLTPTAVPHFTAPPTWVASPFQSSAASTPLQTTTPNSHEHPSPPAGLAPSRFDAVTPPPPGLAPMPPAGFDAFALPLADTDFQLLSEPPRLEDPVGVPRARRSRVAPGRNLNAALRRMTVTIAELQSLGGGHALFGRLRKALGFAPRLELQDDDLDLNHRFDTNFEAEAEAEADAWASRPWFFDPTKVVAALGAAVFAAGFFFMLLHGADNRGLDAAAVVDSTRAAILRTEAAKATEAAVLKAQETRGGATKKDPADVLRRLRGE